MIAWKQKQYKLLVSFENDFYFLVFLFKNGEMLKHNITPLFSPLCNYKSIIWLCIPVTVCSIEQSSIFEWAGVINREFWER